MGNKRYNFNVGDIGSAETLFRTLFRLKEIARECVIPGIVQKYSGKTHYAAVVPLVMAGESTDDGDATKVEYHKRPAVKVKVYQQRHGNFYFDMPLAAGDTGFIVAVDRNWQTARQKNQDLHRANHEGPQNPPSFETASFANGIFIPFSFVNSKKAYEEPTEEDIKRVMRPIEMPDEAITVAVHEWTSPQEAILTNERQGDGFDIGSGLFESSTIVGDGVGGAVLIGRGLVRIQGTGPVGRPTTVFVGGDGTVATNRFVVESLPKREEEKEFHDEYKKADGSVIHTKKAVINPFDDLKESDAKFREMYFLGLADNSDSIEGPGNHIVDWPDGVVNGYGNDSDHIWLMKARILSDIPVKIRKIKIRGAGGHDSISSGIGPHCDCDSYLYDASGSCSVVYDFTYDSQSDSVCPPYTIRAKRGWVRIEVTGSGKRKVLGLSLEEGKEDVRIPTVPISEVVHKWALKSFEEESTGIGSEESQDIPYYLLVRGNPSGRIYRLGVDETDPNNPILSIIPVIAQA